MIARHLVLAAAVALVMIGTAAAQSVRAPFVRVSGSAVVTMQPDQADVDIAITTRRETAQQAAADNARDTTRVLAALKPLVGTTGTIRTVGYSIQPEYREKQRDVVAYIATNAVRLTTTDLEHVGRFVDAAIGVGANRVQRIQFSLKNQQAVYAKALSEAAMHARADADALAAALGMKVVRVIAAEEQSAPGRPLAITRTEAFAASAPETPVEPGTIDVEARVLLTVEVAAAR